MVLDCIWLRGGEYKKDEDGLEINHLRKKVRREKVQVPSLCIVAATLTYYCCCYQSLPKRLSFYTGWLVFLSWDKIKEGRGWVGN